MQRHLLIIYDDDFSAGIYFKNITHYMHTMCSNIMSKKFFLLIWIISDLIMIITCKEAALYPSGDQN